MCIEDTKCIDAKRKKSMFFNNLKYAIQKKVEQTGKIFLPDIVYIKHYSTWAR